MLYQYVFITDSYESKIGLLMETIFVTKGFLFVQHEYTEHVLEFLCQKSYRSSVS